jgi:hypothetical protein
MAKRKTKQKLEFIHATFYCPTLDKSIKIDYKDLNFFGYSSPCEVCGSHGAVTVGFKCKCGKEHELDVCDY